MGIVRSVAVYGRGRELGVALASRSTFKRTDAQTAPWVLPRRVASDDLLRDALEFDDRHVSATFDVADVQFEPCTAPTIDLRPRSCAGRSSGPLPSRLEPRLRARGGDARIHLVGARAAKCLMRTIPVVPGLEGQQLGLHRGIGVGDDQATRAVALQRLDQTFDERDAAVLADGPETLLDAESFDPCLERVGPELPALVRDQMPRAHLGLTEDAREESTYRPRRGLLPVAFDSHDPLGELIGDDSDPPAEGPALWPRERECRRPEPERGGHDTEIGMPNVARVPRDDGLALRLGDRPFLLGRRLRKDHAADGRVSKVQPGPAKELGKLRVPQVRAGHLEAPNHVAYELGELVNGDRKADEGRFSLLVQALHPRRQGVRGQLESLGGLDDGPSPEGPKLQDGHSLDRRVVRPLMGRNTQHPLVLDPQLLQEQTDLLIEPFVFGLDPEASVPVIRRPATACGEGRVRQGHRMDSGRADAARPAPRQGRPEGWRTGHANPRKRSGERSTREQDNVLKVQEIVTVEATPKIAGTPATTPSARGMARLKPPSFR